MNPVLSAIGRRCGSRSIYLPALNGIETLPVAKSSSNHESWGSYDALCCSCFSGLLIVMGVKHQVTYMFVVIVVANA